MLTRHGYIISKQDYSKDEIEQFKRDLTIQPYVDKPEYGIPDPFPVYRESEKRLYLPRYYAINTLGPPKKDALTPGENRNIQMDPNFKLRAYQKPVMDKTLKHLKKDSGGVLALYCGYGKTSCALWLATQLKKKTLVMVHTTTLLNQWVERIHEFVPGAKVGIIQQKKTQVKDKDFVIGMVHSIALKDYPKTLFSSMDFCIIDEIHLMCTKVFSRAFVKIACRYNLGLSATPYRKDRCEKVFQYFIGPIIHYEKRPGNKALVVKCIQFTTPGFYPVRDRNGEPSYVRTLVKLTKDLQRNTALVGQITEMALQKRKVLVLGEFIEQLELLYEMLQTNKEFSTGLYIGRMKQNERKKSQDCDVILGTYKLASVGMDIPDLNTLVMASPRREIEQSVGRILRQSTNKHIKPMIVDFIDSFYYLKHQGRARQAFYRSYNYTVKFYKMTAGVDEKPVLCETATVTQTATDVSGKIEFRSDSDSDSE